MMCNRQQRMSQRTKSRVFFLLFLSIEGRQAKRNYWETCDREGEQGKRKTQTNRIRFTFDTPSTDGKMVKLRKERKKIWSDKPQASLAAVAAAAMCLYAISTMAAALTS